MQEVWGFASISTDFYPPALPAMAAALHADMGTIELTISSYLIGFSLGQLPWAPIGDRYGRRAPVALGLVLFVIGSAGCAQSGSAAAIVGWRVLRAVGSALVSCWRAPERRNSEPLGHALDRYVQLLRERRILDYALAGGFFYAEMFAYIAVTPLAYISYHHVPAQLYGLLFAGGVVGSALVGALADGTPWPMGLVIAMCGLGSFASARALLPQLPGGCDLPRDRAPARLDALVE